MHEENAECEENAEGNALRNRLLSEFVHLGGVSGEPGIAGGADVVDDGAVASVALQDRCHEDADQPPPEFLVSRRRHGKPGSVVPGEHDGGDAAVLPTGC